MDASTTIKSCVGMCERVSDYRDVLGALNKLGKDPVEAYGLFGQRGSEAWQIVKDCGVKKYVFKSSGKCVWIVVGEGAEYIIYEKVGFCSCDDFFHSVMNASASACKHLIAQRLAENLGLYDVVEEADKNYLSRMNDWRKLP